MPLVDPNPSEHIVGRRGWAIMWVNLSAETEGKNMDTTHSWPGIPFHILVLGLVFGVATPMLAQTEPPAAPLPTPTAAPTAIPSSEIPARIGEVAALLRGLRSDVDPREKIVEIAETLPELAGAITTLENEILPVLESDGPLYSLEDTDVDLIRVERRLTEGINTLSKRTLELDGKLTDLISREEMWELTLASAADQELPANLVNQLRDTVASIKNSRRMVADRRAELLTLQTDVTVQRSRIRLLSELIVQELADRQQHILQLDSPPLWRVFGQTGDENLGREVAEAIRRNHGVLAAFVRDSAGALFRDVLIFIVVLVVFVRLGRRAQIWAATDETLRTTAELLRRPVAASVLVTIIVLGSLVHANAPAVAVNLSGVAILLALARLLPGLVNRQLRPLFGILAALIALYLVVDLIPSAFLLDRIGYFLLAVFGGAACAWALVQERSLQDVKRDRWFWGAFCLTATAVIIFALSALANIVGAVAFAELLAKATLSSIYDAISLWIFAVVLFSAVTIGLRTPSARRFLTVRYHSERIRSVLTKIIKVIAVLAWARYALEHFGVLDSAQELVERAFFAQYTVGDFSLSVSGVVVFAFVVWLSVKLAQFISFVLDEDVLPRLDLPKGVPATISKTSTYVVVSLGCVVAIAAAGIDLSKATILVGALGVGIGFGLQNVVNNFVSGLILLFERPVNLGDRIQIGEISGVVQDIGIRASVVRTWQGADVIVPNASLISNNLVNWTLTDQLRRMEVQVGVSYGTSTERVIELLLGVARKHPGVIEDPAPVALFTGFGESSLDFELRAWTVDDFVAIASDLRVGIERTLAGEGIHIPFPQRDLHLLSVDVQTAEPVAEGHGGPQAELPVVETSEIDIPDTTRDPTA